MEGLGSGNEIGVVNDSSLSHVSFFFNFEFFVFFSEFFLFYFFFCKSNQAMNFGFSFFRVFHFQDNDTNFVTQVLKLSGDTTAKIFFDNFPSLK